MVIDGKKFVDSDYPLIESADYIQVLSFLEYGYDYNGDQSDYSIYLYIYNPSGRVVVDSTRNKIQLAPVSNGIAGSYRKYSLELISKSLDNRFLKYSVQDLYGVEYPKLVDELDRMERVYSVSGIELLHPNESNAKDYKVAGTFSYSGYMKGYRKDPTLESSLFCHEKKLLTVELDIGQTVYRTETGKDIDYQNEIISVYFGVPNDLIKNYGDLYRIKCEWYEDQTFSIVTDIKDAVIQWEPFIGQSLKDLPGYDSEEHYLEDFCNFYSKMSGSTENDKYVDISFNMDPKKSIVNFHSSLALNYVPYLFYRESIHTDQTLDVSREEFDQLCEDVGYYFLGTVDEGRTLGYNLKEFTLGDTFSFSSYMDTHSWLDSFWAGFGFDDEFQNDTGKTLELFKEIHLSDLIGDSKTVSDSLCIYSGDIPEIRRVISNNVFQDKTTFLLRAACTDYYRKDIQAIENLNGKDYLNEDCNGYFAKQTWLYDFDIIELTFKSEDGRLTVVPVVASPINAHGGLNGPADPDFDIIWNFLRSIFSFIMGALMFILVIWIIFALIRHFSIRSAFKSGVKSAHKSKKKRRKKR